MATIRQGYSDDFTLKNSKVGIGTSTANEKLEVLGGTRGGGVVVTGIATLTSYEGFQNRNTSYTENVNIAGGESGTLSGEIVVGSGLTMSVGTAATSGQGNIECMKVYDTFNPPCGGTNGRPAAAKPGTIYYNKDFKTIEYWDGSFWRQVDNTTSMGRAALFGGNHNPAGSSISDVGAFSVVSRGEETIFQDMGYSNAGNACGSKTRAILFTGSGNTPNGIQYFTLASLGQGQTFGDTTTAAYRSGGTFSSSTRGVHCGGRGNPGNPHNVIQYVEISTTGNALDFGDLLINGRGQGSGFSSPTRGFSHANAPYSADIQIVTIASKGNATIWGDNTYAGAYQAGTSNTVRGCIAGGYQFPGSAIEGGKSYVTMASEGNAIDFGNLSSDRLGYAYRASSNIRGFVAGGMSSPSSPHPSRKTIDSFLFESKGEILVWGDLSEGKRDGGSTTDCHGGLGGF